MLCACAGVALNPARRLKANQVEQQNQPTSTRDRAISDIWMQVPTVAGSHYCTTNVRPVLRVMPRPGILPAAPPPIQHKQRKVNTHVGTTHVPHMYRGGKPTSGSIEENTSNNESSPKIILLDRVLASTSISCCTGPDGFHGRPFSIKNRISCSVVHSKIHSALRLSLVTDFAFGLTAPCAMNHAPCTAPGVSFEGR